MPTNVLLTRWHGGWAEAVVEQPLDEIVPRRIEGTLGVGAARSETEAMRIARQQLRIFSNERVEILASIEPVIASNTPDYARIPYTGIRVGDMATVGDPWNETGLERLLSVTVSADDLGYPTFDSTWRDVVVDGQEAFAQWLKKMANGTLGGQSKPATPIGQIFDKSPTCCLPPITVIEDDG